MAQAGIIKTITGMVNARTSDGQVRQLLAGDIVYENEIIETTTGSKVTIELNDGKTLALSENDNITLDETVLAEVDAQDAVVTEVEALQAALETGEEIPDEEPAAGAEDEGHDYDLGYYAGDQTRGEVGSRLTPTEYGVQEETFEDIDGEEEITTVITPDPSLSAIGVVVDETDIETANTATGTITVDYGTPTGTLALSAAGATWDIASNTLIYQQDGTNIWQIVLDQDTGEFTFEQLAAFDHRPDGNEHNALEQVGVTVTATNSSGNSETTTFTAGIYDDGPSITPAIEASDIYGDETNGMVTGTIDALDLGVDFGTDGEGSIALSVNGGIWDDASKTLTYYQGTVAAWTIALTGDGENGYGYEFTQLTALNHPIAGDDTYTHHDDVLSWTVSITATDDDGDTANGNFYVEIRDDGPRITGNEILSAELGIAASSPATIPGDVIGMITGDADGEFGTDDAGGGFYLWNNNAATDHIMVEDASNNPIYEIFMDSQTGEWTAYQYQPMAQETLDVDFRIYDGDGDWDDGSFDLPVSQFIVGSNPQEGGDQFEGEGEGEGRYGDDVENFVENDHHEVNPTGADQGAIIGQAGADILVGDPGYIENAAFNNHYIMVMDVSSSMDKIDPDPNNPSQPNPTDRLGVLKETTDQMIRSLYDQVDNSDGGEVTITLLPFDGSILPGAEITLTDVGGTVVITSNVFVPGDPTDSVDTLEDITAWINGIPIGGNGTNYQAALAAALADANSTGLGIEDHVIFISDGQPTIPDANPASYATELSDLSTATNGSIRAIGIGMQDGDITEIYLNMIDGNNDAAHADNKDQLNAVIDEIISDYDLGDAGSDEIYGEDGNDLIFGDVLNTDGVYENLEGGDYDLSTIQDLPDGSGWEVFATLEAANPDSWTRADTIQYIQENHKDLAIETVLDAGTPDEQSREGGHDYIKGGDGDDIIYGQEGNDVIDSGAGNDAVDGGTGFDTLIVTNETELDFSNVSNIEKIHLDEPGVDQNITISLNEVLNMTDSDNRLYITGDFGDTESVTLTGVGNEAGDWEQDGTNPNSFTQIVDGDVAGSASGPTVVFGDWNDTIHVDVVDPTATDFDV